MDLLKEAKDALELLKLDEVDSITTKRTHLSIEGKKDNHTICFTKSYNLCARQTATPEQP